jgi:hypothetical protein
MLISELTAKEEVPPNDSPATGMTWVKTSEKELGFAVNVTDIDKGVVRVLQYLQSSFLAKLTRYELSS